MIVSVLNMKGGAGKTTTATNMAVAFRLEGKSVIIVDTDGKQSSSLYWHGSRDEALPSIDCIHSHEKNSLMKTLKSFKDKYDVIIIDGAPAVDEVTTVAIAMSNLVLIPSKPSGSDALSANLLITHIELIKSTRPELKAAFVMNEVVEGTNIAKDIRAAYVNQFPDIPVLATELISRTAYREAITYGKGIMETGNKKGQDEMKALYEECINIILEPAQ